MKKNSFFIGFFVTMALCHYAHAQRTQVQGNTEINVSTSNTTAVASGDNSVARNRIGVVQGGKTGDTKITANVTNVTTISSGRNKKACTNIGSVVNHECK